MVARTYELLRVGVITKQSTRSIAGITVLLQVRKEASVGMWRDVCFCDQAMAQKCSLD